MPMTRRLTLAGITFILDYPDHVKFERPTTTRYYHSFASAPVAADIVRVTVSPGVTLIPAEAIPLFETGESWSISREGPDYLLSVSLTAYSESLSLTRFKLNDRSVSVTYSSAVERESSAAGRHVPDPFHCPVDRVVLMYQLAALEGALVHSCSASHGGRVFLFPGIAGAGKSTLGRLLAAVNDWTVLSDERAAVRKVPAGYTVFGTPWPGDARIALNASGPLAGVFFLSHAALNEIEPLCASEALRELLPATSVAWYDRGLLPLQLSFVEALVSDVPCFRLRFAPGPAVVEVLERFKF